jgi:site-specific DNA recombinase
VSERHRVDTVTVQAGELDLATTSGRMVARMLGAAARHESEQKGERVRRVRQQAAHAGRAHGPLGYGYTADREIDPVPAGVIREITDRILAGETLYSIAAELNKRDVPTPGQAANGWRSVTIGRRSCEPHWPAGGNGGQACAMPVEGAGWENS